MVEVYQVGDHQEVVGDHQEAVQVQAHQESTLPLYQHQVHQGETIN